jgi:hypothetical protein
MGQQTYGILSKHKFYIIRENRQQVYDPIKRYRNLSFSVPLFNREPRYSQSSHLKRLDHEKLHARHLPIYSTVNSATSVVSTPNHTRFETEWKVGTVSRTVMRALKTISAVVNMCTTNAACDDVGCSRS